jgi:hypothetical protein
MPNRTFWLNIDGLPHIVDVSHDWRTSGRHIRLNGQSIYNATQPFDVGSLHNLTIHDHQVTVCIYPELTLKYGMDVIVNGRSYLTGRAVNLHQYRGMAYLAQGLIYAAFFVFPFVGVPVNFINGLVTLAGIAAGAFVANCGLKNPHIGLPERLLLSAAGVFLTYFGLYMLFFVSGWFAI